ncbi:MAG: transporter [Flavobacteriales bacterium CG_4_9_14_3_um_filter_40_17]|nr:MAG: transporter [Flavobacteriales bacterium CG_4_9_14_3_um_filter_40_17]
MKKACLTIFLLSLLSIRGFGQEKKGFSLEEAITYAIENNYAAMGASMDVKAAIQKKWETTATGLPQISGSVDYRNNLKQQVTLFDVNGDGIDEPFTFGTKQTMTVFGTVDQIIFDGSYLVGLQSAITFLNISKQTKEKTDLDVRENVIQAYGNALLTDENIKILENNKNSAEQTLNETQAMFEQGLAEEESVEQLQITLSTLENSLNRTRRLQDIAYKMLNLTLGLDIETLIELTDNLDALTIQDMMYDTEGKTFDLENNIDFKIAKTNTRSQELLLKLEKSRALPTLNASLNGGTTANSDSFTFLSSGNGQRWFASSLFNLSLKVPLFSSLERSAKTKQARIALMQAQTQQKETEQRIRLNYETAKTDFQFSVETFQTSKKNLNLAERIEHKNQIKFKEGIASSFELTEAQRQLYTAQQNYLQAMIDVINKKAALETIVNK